MMYKKIAISIPDQIEKLEERGLKFGDKPFAERTLSNISYYRLRAYTYPFQDNTDEDLSRARAGPGDHHFEFSRKSALTGTRPGHILISLVDEITF